MSMNKDDKAKIAAGVGGVAGAAGSVAAVSGMGAVSGLGGEEWLPVL